MPGADPTTARAYFERHVAGELAWRCAAPACHGVPIDEYRSAGPSWYALPLDAEQAITSPEAIDIAYRESTGDVEIVARPGESTETLRLKKESASRRLDRHAPPIFSELVRKPIPVALGGLPHRGGDNYVSLSGAGIGHLLEWIEMERTGDAELDAGERRFRDEVMPVLRDRGCTVTSCHGPNVGNLYKLDPGIGGEWSGEMIHANAKASAKFVNVGASDPLESRLLRKALPPALGGIAHRGSNELFDEGDPGLAAVEGWIRDVSDRAGVDPRPRGVVFVVRPPSPRPYFDVGAFRPGADLFLAPLGGGPVVNLTAAHHAGPADIRTPEVSPDGTQILFSMRKDESDCLNVYRMAVDGSALTPLTRDTGCRRESLGPDHANTANLSPRFGPSDVIYFISTKGGVVADDGAHPDTNLWAMDLDGANPRQLTFSPGHEIDLSLATKSGKAILVFTSMKEISENRHGALYFVPAGWWSDYHPMFGEQSKYPVFAQSSELPDLRTLVVLMGFDARFQAGALAIFDRNMGPDLEDPNDMARVALPGFVRALANLSDDRGALGGACVLWKTPIALPDGRVIASRSTEPIDARSSSVTPTFELVALELSTNPASRLPEIASEAVLFGSPGLWAEEPALIVERKLPAAGESYLRSDLPAGTGLVQLYDAFTLETILRDNRPIGRRSMVDGRIAGLRAVFGRGLTPEEARPIDPSRVQNGDPKSTRISNGVHGRTWAVGPLPVMPDGSIYFRLPSIETFYLQAVDADGMAIGMQYDRWLFLNEGEAFGNGVATRSYDTVCGGCHGSYTGEMEESFGGVDVVSSASVTLATHEDERTRKQPLDATAPSFVTAVSFASELGPLLERRCAGAGCHASNEPSGGLDLGPGAYTGPWSNAYESLMRLGAGSGSPGPFQKEYVDERNGRAARSYLVEKIFDRELEAPRSLERGGCEASSVLSLEDKKRIVVWIDTGATFLGRDDP
jgi:hypothetical protein